MGTRYASPGGVAMGGMRPVRCSMILQGRQLLILATVVMAAGCGSKKSSQSDEAVSELGTPPANVLVRRPYVLNDAGIRFNPPASWDVARIDVVSRSGKEAAASLPNADFSISFDYKAEQPAHRNTTLVNLYVVHKSQWKRTAAHAAVGAVVDSTTEWVFVAALAKDNPYREGLLDADQFEAMRLTLDDVRDAFSIANGGPADESLRAESRRK